MLIISIAKIESCLQDLFVSYLIAPHILLLFQRKSRRFCLLQGHQEKGCVENRSWHSASYIAYLLYIII